MEGWLWLYRICGYQEEMGWLFPRVFFHVSWDVDVGVLL